MLEIRLKRLLAKWRRSSARLRTHGWAGAALARENDVEDLEKLLKAAETGERTDARKAAKKGSRR